MRRFRATALIFENRLVTAQKSQAGNTWFVYQIGLPAAKLALALAARNRM